ncbi:MAG: hypothetical protein ACXVXY_12610, partial [Mycobacteriaceae bacterium]
MTSRWPDDRDVVPPARRTVQPTRATEGEAPSPRRRRFDRDSISTRSPEGVTRMNSIAAPAPAPARARR